LKKNPEKISKAVAKDTKKRQKGLSKTKAVLFVNNIIYLNLKAE
jgi:hypothetical protein